MKDNAACRNLQRQVFELNDKKPCLYRVITLKK
jgi:hypothetical protein